MYHFFAKKENITDRAVYITGGDYNHAVNVLRLKRGEKILISDTDGNDYDCTVDHVLRKGEATEDGANFPEDALRLEIMEACGSNHELPAQIVLFQCLPKSDKMELIIQKAAELGVSCIVPVASKNCVTRLDGQKAEAKQKRWQAIAESAAKQSKRSIVPEIFKPVSFKEAVDMAGEMDVKLIPYEAEDGIESLCEAIINFIPKRSICIIIGPEGGFDPLEVSMAKRHGITPVSLGKRILRTETAAIALLSLIMIRLEIVSGMDLEEN